MFSKIIYDSFYQGFFRADDYHLDAEVQARIPNCLKIRGIEGNISAKSSRARITGTNKKRGARLTLGDFPGQGVFSSAPSE